MKKESIKKNYIYNMIYQLLLIIIPVITTPYLARVLGANGNGIYGYTISIVTYFILFGSLGISLYGQREIAYNQKDKSKRSNIFWELLLIRLITMTISAIIFYFVFCISGKYFIYFRILLLEMLANVLDISWFFQGIEDFKKITIRNFIVKAISVICIFLFVKEHNDVNIYLFIYTISTLFGSLTLWFSIGNYISKPIKLKIIKHIPNIITLFIPQIAIQVYIVLDKTMIGSILHDMYEVGYYEQSQKIIKILLTLVTAISTVMLPRIANCYAEKNKEKIMDYMKKTFNFIFFASFPLMFGIMAISHNFAPLFFGKGYDKVPLLMIILSTIILFISISSIIGHQYLLSTKRQREYTISVICGALTNFILNLILIKMLKSYGAAIATAVAECVVAIIQMYFIRNDFNLKKILSLSTKYLFSGIIMLLICLIIDLFITNRLIGIICQICFGSITYLIVLLLLKDKFLYDLFNNNIKPILNRIFRKKAI